EEVYPCDAGIQARAGGFGDQERGAKNTHGLAHYQGRGNAKGHGIPQCGPDAVESTAVKT
ncbi:hypothetical protein SB724_20335, partial [Bacillus sp. SIMBA_031]